MILWFWIHLVCILELSCQSWHLLWNNLWRNMIEKLVLIIFFRDWTDLEENMFWKVKVPLEGVTLADHQGLFLISGFHGYNYRFPSLSCEDPGSVCLLSRSWLSAVGSQWSLMLGFSEPWYWLAISADELAP